MGKKSRKLRSPKYAAKAAAFRKTVARLRQKTEQVIEDVVVTVADQVVQVAEKADKFLDETQERINALKFINENEVVQVEEPVVKTPKAEKPKVTRKSTTTTKKNPTTKKTTSTTRRRRTTKTKTDT